ncbi:MAG TPA: branched chain amino acid aminotransferase [Flavobacteriales bacterium]|nr:branched chain amino acid aminotransferase [Flavobacteriales bacterium]|tara:strand:+ start:28284 stop:29360 length:1077 start_codon:yes stop_codon:yes gene_type:complete
MQTAEKIIDINVNKTNNSRLPQIDFNNIVFGKNFSDHMFVADYKDGEWQNFTIRPYEEISLSPACAAIHYGQAIFEGMKAYRNANDEVFLFRPDQNAKRLNISASRMCMPEFPEEYFMEALKQLLTIDRDWIPNVEGSSLYIRPYMFASEELLGVRPANEYKFMIFTAPVGAYYSKPVNVKIEKEYTRACEGGVGYAKAAGNYAAALYPAKLAQEKGFDQLIWTDAKEHKYIEESGTMNVMFVVDGKIITPNLDYKTTLAGITRDSVLTLAHDMGIPVEERRVTVEEIVQALKENRLTEAFGTGTAATIAQIATIANDDDKYTLPPIESREISNAIAKRLNDIKLGVEEDKFGWTVKL